MYRQNYHRQPYPPQPQNPYRPAAPPRSYFDGGLLSLVGHRIVAFLITFFTLGIMTPWAICYLQRWEACHTVIDGRRLVFVGTAMGLFGHWIKWFLLSLITLGIYGFWVQIKLRQWVVRHTHFAR